MINTTHKSAGVYTSVTDLSPGAASLAASVVGMVGMAAKGSINKRVPVRSPDDLTNIFGKRDPRYGLGLYIAEPISEQTNSMMYVRLAKNAKYAVAVLTVDDPAAVQPVIRLSNYVDDNGDVVGVNSPDQLGFLPTDPLNDNIIGYFILENPGKWNDQMSLQVRPSVPLGLNAFDDRRSYNPKQFYVDEFQNFENGSSPAQTHTCTLFDYKDDFDKQYRITTCLEEDDSNFRFIQNEYFVHDIEFLTTDFVFMKGGDDGDKLTSDDIAKGFEDYFGDPEEVRVTLLVSSGLDDHILHRSMKATADKHINCHVIGSFPTAYQSVTKAIQYRRQILNLNTRNVSLYTSDIKIFDKDTGRYLWVPCVGQVAAAYCLTDNNRGQWFAPAGITASAKLNILGLRFKYDQEDRDAFTREQINYIRKLPAVLGGGYAIWEASTLLNTDSAFQMVPIQRMVSYVLEVCHRSAKIGLFDPNDDILRQQLKAMVEKFLEEIKLARGLRGGNSGSQGYVVVCNDVNNTPQTIANGDLVMDIILDPTRMTKRIIYRFNINPKGSTSTTLA